jgi:uncharacterized protein YdeI (YjbR/CyaY-like superfamily)
MEMIPEVDLYLEEGCGRCKLYQTPQCKVHTWPQELKLLRKLVLECGLTEELKWSMPCYTFNGKNILMVNAFKDFAALSFFKGALLSDPEKLLHFHGENSQSGKSMRFNRPDQIASKLDLIKSYIFEAIEVEKAGLKVEFKQKNELELPEELTNLLEQTPALAEAFEALTPGRKRSYVLHISGAKQAKTRESRAEKCIPKIMSGKGFNEY